ncbi:hypothetical protein ACNF42_04420 [Cuniculiplasma sp. SKW3]|uniref:hypothetical protein n=1 Tax=Cuniculiplasma sp. SKW3 TaxID=3400170 RepID=UPI003FD373F5
MPDQEEVIIREMKKRNTNLRKDFSQLGKKTNHANISMIVDEIISAMEKYSSCLEKRGTSVILPKKEDLGISLFRKVKDPDPESLQSVLLYVSGKLMNEVEEDKNLTKDMKSECIDTYIDGLESLRIHIEHLYHNLVEKQL